MQFLKKYLILIVVVIASIIFVVQYFMSFMTAPKEIENQYQQSFYGLNNEDLAKNQQNYVGSNTYADISEIEVKESLSVPYIETENVLGAIYIPSLNIKLPITYTKNSNLFNSSAVVLNGGLKLGEGNYIIGSNSSNKNKKILFTSLVYAEKKEKIFITDKKTIYLYEIETKEKINTNRTDILDKTEGKNYLSLVSKNGSGENQKLILVKAKLITKAEYKTAGDKLLGIFGTP